jgi:hypothetical protein
MVHWAGEVFGAVSASPNIFPCWLWWGTPGRTAALSKRPPLGARLSEWSLNYAGTVGLAHPSSHQPLINLRRIGLHIVLFYGVLEMKSTIACHLVASQITISLR